MLPERKRRLIIGFIGGILFIALVISIFAISNYVKSKNVEKKDIDDRPNSVYPTDYLLYGLTVDTENIVRLYGLTDNYTEKYLGIRSFYKDQDNIVKDGHLFMYFDCVNELRYDNDLREYYLYKYDEYYSNNVKIKLAKNYIILFDKTGSVSARKYNEGEPKDILSNVSYDNTFIKGNIIYYTDINGLHRYRLNNDANETIFDYKEYTEKPVLKILTINDNYIAYTKDGDLNIYANQLNYSKAIDVFAELIGISKENIMFLELTNDGFYFQVANEDGTYSIKKFSLIKNKLDTEEYVTKYKVNEMKLITKGLYYMNITIDSREDYILFSTKEKDVVKNLENKYIYISSLEDNNDN